MITVGKHYYDGAERKYVKCVFASKHTVIFTLYPDSGDEYVLSTIKDAEWLASLTRTDILPISAWLGVLQNKDTKAVDLTTRQYDTREEVFEQVYEYYNVIDAINVTWRPNDVKK